MNLDSIDWGLIDKYFGTYGLYAEPERILERSDEFVRRIRKETTQLIFYGIVLGLFLNFAGTWLFEAVSSAGTLFMTCFWAAFSAVSLISTWLFLKRMIVITHQDVFRKDREAELLHEYFIDQIRESQGRLDQKKLWDELVRRKYGT